MKKIILISLLIALPIFLIAIYTVNSAGLNINARIPAAPSCGNGTIDVGESCDNGSSNGPCPNTCSSSCTNNCCGAGCGSGTTDVYCNGNCNVNSCVSGLTCYDDPGLGKVCRHPQALNSSNCLLSNDVKISIRAWPEFRLPATSPNYTLPGVLEILNQDNGSVVTTTTFIAGKDGWAIMGIPDSAFPVLPGNYGIRVKGISHLLKATSSAYLINKTITTQDGNNQIDFTNYATKYFEDCPGICRETYNRNVIDGSLLAGDVLTPKDNYINGGDISAIASYIYSNNQDADLNWDGVVNGGDISIWAKNIYKKGE